MKQYVVLLTLLMTAPLAAREIAMPQIDRTSLPQHWYLRDASEFAKLGMTSQTLVYQPDKGQSPLATVLLESRPIARKMSRDPKTWTRILIPTLPGPSWGMEEPSMTVRNGTKIWRAEMHSDTDVNNQHWIMMQAMEIDGALVVMAFEQTRGYYKERLPFVLDLFEHVRPASRR